MVDATAGLCIVAGLQAFLQSFPMVFFGAM
eukprot:COSAG05_NODE_778_length_7403_cov_636.272180_8_plen_30_part_00